MCSITRYTSNTQENRKRILSSTTDGNFLHGHWNFCRGITFAEIFLTDPGVLNNGNGSESDEDMTKWLVMCAKNNANGSSISNDVLADGNSVGTSTSGIGGQTNLNINRAEKLDFGFNQLIVFDTVLTDDELKIVSDYLQNYLIDGVDELEEGYLPRNNTVTQIQANNKIKIAFENNNTIVNINEDGLSINDETLTEELLGFLTPVTSNIQEQFNIINTKTISSDKPDCLGVVSPPFTIRGDSTAVLFNSIIYNKTGALKLFTEDDYDDNVPRRLAKPYTYFQVKAGQSGYYYFEASITVENLQELHMRLYQTPRRNGEGGGVTTLSYNAHTLETAGTITVTMDSVYFIDSTLFPLEKYFVDVGFNDTGVSEREITYKHRSFLKVRYLHP
jgi:hypothetical protein